MANVNFKGGEKKEKKKKESMARDTSCHHRPYTSPQKEEDVAMFTMTL
jgi:hypothetical protein